MITVRFPSGFSVQYNTGNYVVRSQLGYSDIYEKKDSGWLAQVPNEALIEVSIPCRTYFAASPDADVRAELKQAQHQLELARRQIRRLKGTQ